MATPQEKGKQFETDLASEFGLKMVPGSGNVWYDKMDLKGKGARWSLKYTSKEKFPITFEDIIENLQVCFGSGGTGEIPIWASRIQENDYITMRKEDFKLMQTDHIILIEQDRPQVAARKERAKMPELLREEK